jgi:LacI family transcriptional regulator
MHASHKHGLKVGRDIAFVWFDGTADPTHTQPPLITLDYSVYTIARRLVTMVLALINGEPLAERQVKFQPGYLFKNQQADKMDIIPSK